MSKAEDEKFMRLALAECMRGIRNRSGPFGCVIVKNGKVVGRGINTVVRSHDCTGHAEVNAFRNAGKKIKAHDFTGCTVYATTEPCPMCFGAIHWSKARRIVYGASIEDAAAAGLNELKIHDSLMKRLGNDKVEIVKGVLRNECVRVLREWGANPKSVKY